MKTSIIIPMFMIGTSLVGLSACKDDNTSYESETMTTDAGWTYDYVEIADATGYKISIGFPSDYLTAHSNIYLHNLAFPVLMQSGYGDVLRPDMLAQFETMHSNAYFYASNGYYYIDIFANEDEIDLTTQLYPDIIYGSRYDEDVLEETRIAVTEGTARYLLDATAKANLMLDEAFFENSKFQYGQHNFDISDINDVDMDDIKAWFQDVLTHGGVKIAVAGKKDPAQINGLIDRALNGLNPNAAPRIAEDWEFNSTPRMWVLEQDDLDKSVIYIAAPIQKELNNEEGRLLSFVNGSLSGGDGRLNKVIREKLRASYGFNGSIRVLGNDHYYLLISGEVDPSALKDTIIAINEILDELKLNGIAQDEFDVYIDEVLTQFDENRDDENFVAYVTLNERLVLEPETGIAEILERYEDDTLEDVNEVIKSAMPKSQDIISIIVTPSAVGINADCVIKDISEVESCK